MCLTIILIVNIKKNQHMGQLFYMLHFGDNHQRIIGQTQKDNLASLYIKCMEYIKTIGRNIY